MTDSTGYWSFDDQSSAQQPPSPSERRVDMTSSASASAAPAAPAVSAFTTPTKRAAFASTEQVGRARPSGASPAYSSRRHSLYGIEDRVVIDPGSRIWKVGFSGEPDPRALFWARRDDLPSTSSSAAGSANGSSSSSSSYTSRRRGEEPLRECWDFDPSFSAGPSTKRSEGDRLVGVRIIRNLREAFIKCLMTDSKARKVIIVENTFLPTFVKEHIARALFDNLKVPSVSFTPSSLLALAACGRSTGLVVDAGWLETSITPVFHSRPLYTLSRSTPLAGRRLHRRLRALLRRYGTYIAPPSSMGTVHTRPRTLGIPSALLTDGFVERVLTEGCLVGPPVSGASRQGMDEEMDVDVLAGSEQQGEEDDDDQISMERIRRRYENSSKAKDMTFPVPPLPGDAGDMGAATILIPGWVRERAADLLFSESADADADQAQAQAEEDPTIPRAILDTILKLPLDLRATMISSILVVGGTASLPGFIPRLRVELLSALSPNVGSQSSVSGPEISAASKPAPPNTRNQNQKRMAEEAQRWRWRRRNQTPFAELVGLRGKVGIVNDPAPLDLYGSGSDRVGDASASASGTSGGDGGKAPRWTPGLMAWVGGSLAGALKTGAPELLRETYDTLLSDSYAKGDEWREAQDMAEVEIAAEVGVSLEDLRAGEALRDARTAEFDGGGGGGGAQGGEGGAGEEGEEGDEEECKAKPRARKRGWEQPLISDWSRMLKT